MRMMNRRQRRLAEISFESTEFNIFHPVYSSDEDETQKENENTIHMLS